MCRIWNTICITSLGSMVEWSPNICTALHFKTKKSILSQLKLYYYFSHQFLLLQWNNSGNVSFQTMCISYWIRAAIQESSTWQYGKYTPCRAQDRLFKLFDWAVRENIFPIGTQECWDLLWNIAWAFWKFLWLSLISLCIGPFMNNTDTISIWIAMTNHC